MAFLTGPYWAKMHMTFAAHVGGFIAAAKRQGNDDAVEWFKAARKYDRDGRTDQAVWAAVHGAQLVSEYGRVHTVGYIGFAA